MKDKIDPYPDVVAKYPQGRIGHHNLKVQEKNIKGLPKMGDVIILPIIIVKDPKSN